MAAYMIAADFITVMRPFGFFRGETVDELMCELLLAECDANGDKTPNVSNPETNVASPASRLKISLSTSRIMTTSWRGDTDKPPPLLFANTDL
jgi:hypothetical protein